MSNILSLVALASTAVSPFNGEWNCTSAFSGDPFSLSLVVDESQTATSARIYQSTDARLPDGVVRLLDSPEKVENPTGSALIPDLRWHGQVQNRDGDVSFTMLWDRNDGVSVNLWQYFTDGSPSKLMGAMACTGVEA